MPTGSLTPRVLLAGFIVLLLNSVYLWAFADPTLWYFVQVALHPFLGLALGIAVAVMLVRRRWAPGWLAVSGLVLSGFGLALGLGVLALGATTPYRMLVNAHSGTSSAGAALLLLYAWLAAPRWAGAANAWTVRGAVAAVLI